MERVRFNWYYWFTGFLFAAMLFISAKYFKGKGEAAIGLAQTREYKISSEKSGLVKVVNVVPGMQVQSGDLLIELSSQELEIEIAKLTTRIEILKSERAEKAKLTQAEIDYIKAENDIRLEEIEAEIQQTTSELQLNKSLTREFVSKEDESESPLQIKINSLKQQKQKLLLAQEIKIKDVRQENATEQKLLENQIVLQESELELLHQEKKGLTKAALAPGVIKTVFVKVGEQVSSYSPLLEINPIRPTTVVIYLIGKPTDQFPIGKEVTVSSYAQKRTEVIGKVIGYGSVTALPEILQKSTAVKAFGQEVFIEVPVNNALANGEKVLVK